MSWFGRGLKSGWYRCTTVETGVGGPSMDVCVRSPVGSWSDRGHRGGKSGRIHPSVRSSRSQVRSWSSTFQIQTGSSRIVTYPEVPESEILTGIHRSRIRSEVPGYWIRSEMSFEDSVVVVCVRCPVRDTGVRGPVRGTEVRCLSRMLGSGVSSGTPGSKVESGSWSVQSPNSGLRYRRPRSRESKVHTGCSESPVRVGPSGTMVRSTVLDSELLVGMSGSEVWSGTPEF